MQGHIYKRKKYKVNFEAYTSRINSFNTFFPTPEASVGRLGRKVFSTDVREVSKVSELSPLATVLLHLCKSIEVSGYIKQDVYTSTLPAASLASFQGSSLPSSWLSHHALLDRRADSSTLSDEKGQE